MTTICVIPARGGSQRIHKKNIVDFHGKPIIIYSIDGARESGLFDQIVVTTDSGQIADIAHKAGAHAVWRPAWLAMNEVGTQEVATTTLAMFAPDLQYAACVYPTAPMMTPDDLRRGMALLKNNEAQHDFAMAVGSAPLRDAGQWYIGTAAAFVERRPLISPRTLMVPIPEDRVCDINTDEDLAEAHRMYTLLHQGIVK